MITPLKRIALKDLLRRPVMFDANIFMVGISERNTDKDYSFENMVQLYIRPMFESFTDILIHTEVYNELDKESREFVDEYLGENVKLVSEEGMYGTDPKYTMIFNEISKHELINYKRGKSKDKGEVFSLAYAAYHNINFVCSKEIMVDTVSRELEVLKNIDVITFDIIILQAYVYYARRNDNTNSKGLKAIYKKHCEDVIKRHQLPLTLGEYIKASQDYL